MHAIFLDRDGVICENRSDYVKTWDEFKFLPCAKESLVSLSRLGLPIVIITNQSAINRGLTTATTVDDIHRRMTAEIHAAGGRVDRVFYCPHRPDEACDCRKPRAGMLRRAEEEMHLDLSRSYVVGDALTDLQVGLSVGATPVMVLTGRGLQQLPIALQSLNDNFHIAHNLLDATKLIIKSELTPSLSSHTPQLIPAHG